ncbi:rhomboid family intramembrane serine protease, partial [Candidatus Woesearchaeota archaeon]|nr:rhomboid family intramembrane serine protease [Candidatus Woesearchaeota archaeon]
EHLMYNLFALALFGIILENIIGTKKFMLIFFMSGIVASVISSFFYNSALGASGAIFGILGALALLRPNMTIWIYFMPMPMYIAGIVYLIINFFGAYFLWGIFWYWEYWIYSTFKWIGSWSLFWLFL